MNSVKNFFFFFFFICNLQKIYLSVLNEISASVKANNRLFLHMKQKHFKKQIGYKTNLKSPNA